MFGCEKAHKGQIKHRILSKYESKEQLEKRPNMSSFVLKLFKLKRKYKHMIAFVRT